MKLISNSFLKFDKTVITLFLFCFAFGFSQIENSKRKIEFLPPSSAAIKKLNISPINPNYFSIKKRKNLILQIKD